MISSSDNHDHTTVNLNSTRVLRIETSTVQPESATKLNDELARFWDLETLGIKEEETSVYEKFTQEVKFNGNPRYEAKLPFKEEQPLIPHNCTVCVKRLGSLITWTCPLTLNATLKHHVNQYANVDPDVVDEVMRLLYVDDCASGSRDVKSALQLLTKIKTRFTDEGFNMRKWTSNSQELMEELQKAKRFPNRSSR